MIQQPRYYQQEASDAVIDYWQGGGGNPLTVMATGTGKSLTQAITAKRLMTDYDGFRILCLVHVKELVEQNATALLRAWPSAPIGINSAGIGRRDTWHPILFASIQSVWRKPELLGHRDAIFIDECQLVPKKSLGMYRALLDEMLRLTPDLRMAGWTATPFRLDSGRLDQGPDKLFDKMVYDYGIKRGIDDGYLCPLVPFRMDNEIDTSNLRRSGGDFTDASVAAAADNDAVLQAAVSELHRHGENRRAWLSFCCGIEHAEKMAEESRRQGVQAVAITSHTTATDRARIIADYKAGNGHVRHLTNAMVLTTGFDAPITDVVSLFRPTLSTVLYVQCLGRGTRLMGLNIAESIENGKPDCLVLDFAGNVRRHGPVDTVDVGGESRGVQLRDPPDMPMIREEDVRATACPHCGVLNHIAALRCTTCDGVIREDKPKHDPSAEGGLAILSRDKDPWEPVNMTTFYHHPKLGSAPSMRVEYRQADRLTKFHKEWVAFEHRGFARDKAEMWWKRLGGAMPVPRTVDEALSRKGELRVVTQVKMEKKNDFDTVVGRRLHPTERVGDSMSPGGVILPGAGRRSAFL